MGGALDEDAAKLVDEFQEVFKELPPIEVCERPIKHQIKLIPGEAPRYPTQNYNLSSDDLAELKRQIKDLLEKKFIEPTQAPFAAPVFLNFNEKAKPLHDLLKEKSLLVWRPKHSQAVKELKDALINVTMTNIFNPDLPLVIKTDASKYAVGAVLEQDGKPIAFESRKKLGREIHYPAYESELLAIVYALTKWKHFIGTRLVTIETDHATLSRMLTQKKVTSRLGYWLDKLADFNFQVLYKPGKQNLVADALSRRPDYMEKVAMLIESQEPGGDDRRVLREAGRLDWEEAYNNCEDFGEIIKTCKALGIDEDTGKYIPLIEGGKEYHWEDNLLWIRLREGWRLCTPTKDKRLEVLQGFHDDSLAGHPGIDKTIADIEKIFWWPNMKGEIERYVRSCSACAQGKASYSKYGGLLCPLPIPNFPWEVINVDLILGLPKGRNGLDAIVTFVCQLTKMAHFIPVYQTIGAEGLGHVLVREVVRLHGVPSAIVSDRDSRFTSEIWRGMCQRLNISMRMSTAYHPQTDGLAERTNQTIEQMIRCTILGNEYRWVEVLPMLEFAYNSTVRVSTKASPFEMLYGFVPCKPICRKYGLPMTVPAANLPLQAEITLRRAKLELEKAQATQQLYANTRRRAVEFEIGDKVWLRVSHLPMATSSSSKALALRYRGPFKVIGKVGRRAYKLKLPPSMLVHPVFHVSLLKPWQGDISELRSTKSSQLAICGNEYEVQGIFKHREDPVSRTKWYKVLWMDGTSTWEPEGNLEGCPRILTNYYRGIQRNS
ncbi:retrotransposon ty3-gypsy subclass [Cystoisospora suis]|uniref:Retrotransposon ty3-gypsy subclass n=1 Tax=Cystoisospora suis TaxID=483139 RepID=A0A2C6LD09_9APIC|nr:retrotransposon ty3-gypsy subclass [Cystoisospora suis]